MRPKRRGARWYAPRMADELQRLVDRFADRFSRSVAVDDANLRLLAYSAHQGAVDEARVTSILQRCVPQEAMDYTFGLGAKDAADIFTDPPCEEIGQTIARIGMPIRFEARLLGFIWLMESDGELTDDLADGLRAMATEAAAILDRRVLLDEDGRAREAEYARGLLSDDADTRRRVAERVCTEGLLSAQLPVIAIVLRSTAFETGEQSTRDRLAIAVGLDAGRKQVRGMQAICVEQVDQGILLVNYEEGTSAPALVAIGAAIHNAAVVESRRSDLDWWVGIGRAVEITAADTSLTDARRAAEIVAALKTVGTVATNEQLGIYSLLAEVPRDRLLRALAPAYLRLVDVRGHDDVLVNTLEVYLDNACNARRASEALCIERASLYYRLRRIEAISGCQLNDGTQRLAMHQTLKVARLIGLR